MAIGIRFKKTSVDQTETGMGTLIKLNSGGPGQLSIGVLKQIRDRCIEAETNAKESEEIASNAAISATASADSALDSKNIATTAATSAAQSESNAAISAGSASDNALSSASSAYQASNSAQQSADSATAAETSKVAAKASEDAAAASALAAANSAEAARLSKLSAADSEANALGYKNDAYNSKLDAEEAARQAKFLVEGGTVDGGAWDASTGIYPDKPFVLDDQGQPLYVSGFWKVSGNGTVEGIDYSINDTLRYSASLDEFYKIDSTESVTSVNGKKGAVLLNYEDVGAVSSTDGNILGSLKFSQNGIGNPLGIYFGQTLNRSDRALYGDALSVQVGSTDKQLQLFGLNDLKFNGQKVFHEGFLPTNSDVGLSSITQDINGMVSISNNLTLKDRIVITSNASALGVTPQVFHNGNGSVGDVLTLRAMRESSNSTVVWEKYRNGEIRYSTGSTPGGTNTIVINPASGGVAANRIYAGANANSGYFFSDVVGRTAFTGGDFYIQESTPITRIFSPDIRLSTNNGNISIAAGTAIRGSGFTLETSKLTMSSITGQTRKLELSNINVDFSDTSSANASGIRYISRNDGSIICGFGSYWNGTDDTITTAFGVGEGNAWYNGGLFRVTKEGDVYAGRNTITKRVRLLEPRIETDQPYVGFFTPAGLAKAGCMGSLTVSNDYSAISATPATGIYSIGNIRTANHVYTTNANIYGASWGHVKQPFIDIQGTSATTAYTVIGLNGGAGVRLQFLGGDNPTSGAARLMLNNDKSYYFATSTLVTPGTLTLGNGHIDSPGAVNGNYGSISINGHKGGYAGIHFDTPSRTFMVGVSVQGIHDGSAWQWYFNNGVLTAGSVPYARTTGVAAASHTHGDNDVTTLGNRISIDVNGKLHVNNTLRRSAGMYGIYDSTRVGHIWSMGIAYKILDDGTDFGNLYGAAYAFQTVTNLAGGHQFLWCQNGTVYVALGNGVWSRNNIYAYSDIRVKKNIRVIDNALDRIRRSNGCFFNRTDGDDPNKLHVGVIAQNMLETLPEVVGGGPTDKDPDSKYSVAYGNITALLIEGIKEQDSIVQAQEEVIETLREEVARLTGRLDNLELLLTKILEDK